MKLTCWGAAGTVTGSMHLVETESGKKILIDCGIHYEKNKDLIDSNLDFPFNPKSIDAVILTHAHIDHSGNLPNLVRQGFSGPIYCTPATKELTYHLLEDSLNIQIHSAEKKAEFKKVGKKKKTQSKSVTLLYHFKHIKQTFEQIVTVDYNQAKTFLGSNEFEFYNSGHILGAASVVLKVLEGNTYRTIGFTGDLGNNNSKLVVNPTVLPQPDYLVSESTYGGRYHTAENDAKEILLEQIQKTCVNLSGKLIIPAFSVGRTQAILFTLNQLYVEGRLPNIKVYTDSPLAIKTTEMYEQYIDILNDEAKEFYKKNHQLFEYDALHTLTNPKHSEAISLSAEPCVIVSAAGMLEGGRIQQHIRNNISNPFSTILIAGYCADGTLGHRLLSGMSHININKRERAVMAQIKKTDVYSAHLDHNGLLVYIKQSVGENTKKVILVHSGPQSAIAIKESLNRLSVNAEVAEKGKVYDLD